MLNFSDFTQDSFGLSTCLFPFRSTMNGVKSMLVPCGKCSACINSRKKNWITRCFFESKIYDSSVFLTLTYSNENIPTVETYKGSGSYVSTLKPDDVSLFLKRLRTYYWSKYKRRLRYFYSGEYGTSTKRPHYHLVLFGVDLNHFVCFDEANPKDIISNKFDDLWGLGNTRAERFKSGHSKYVVGYVSKKLGDYSDFLLDCQCPEFTRCSTRPPLGYGGLKLFVDNLKKANSPFLNYIPTKHFSTLERFFLQKLYPDYKVFPNIIFFRPDSEKDTTKGSFYLVDFDKEEVSNVSNVVKKLAKNGYSFFRFDRTFSRLLCDFLRPSLRIEIEDSIVSYVKDNSTFFDTYNFDVNYDNAVRYFVEYNKDELYSLFLDSINNSSVNNLCEFIYSDTHLDNLKRFNHQQHMSEFYDKD